MHTASHPAIISAHADYRPSDYAFARTQSRQQSPLEWERREKPLHSWSEMLYPVLSLAAAAALALGILH